jgi:hypothetical protein
LIARLDLGQRFAQGEVCMTDASLQVQNRLARAFKRPFGALAGRAVLRGVRVGEGLASARQCGLASARAAQKAALRAVAVRRDMDDRHLAVILEAVPSGAGRREGRRFSASIAPMRRVAAMGWVSPMRRVPTVGWFTEVKRVGLIAAHVAGRLALGFAPRAAAEHFERPAQADF